MSGRAQKRGKSKPFWPCFLRLPVVSISRYVLHFFKLLQKRQENLSTCFTLQNKLQSYVVHFDTHIQTCLATNQVFASCMNTDFWLHKIMSHYTWNLCLCWFYLCLFIFILLQHKFTLVLKTHNMYCRFCCKEELFLLPYLYWGPPLILHNGVISPFFLHCI